MKRPLAALTALAACLLLSAGCVPEKNAAEDCLRLHIIANSNSVEDQTVKLAVRDAILECVNGSFRASTKEEAREELIALGGLVQECSEETLRENGMDYGVQLITGEFDFPDRYYGTELYPAGKYDALRVVLGDGAGENWWCVMFPPLCVIETDESPAEFNEDGTLVIKSFVWDFIKGVFGL